MATQRFFVPAEDVLPPVFIAFAESPENPAGSPFVETPIEVEPGLRDFARYQVAPPPVPLSPLPDP